MIKHDTNFDLGVLEYTKLMYEWMLSVIGTEYKLVFTSEEDIQFRNFISMYH